MQIENAPVVAGQAGPQQLIAGWLPKVRGAPFQAPAGRSGSASRGSAAGGGTGTGEMAGMEGPPSLTASGTGSSGTGAGPQLLANGLFPKLPGAPFRPPQRSGSGVGTGSGSGPGGASGGDIIGPPSGGGDGQAPVDQQGGWAGVLTYMPDVGSANRGVPAVPARSGLMALNGGAPSSIRKVDLRKGSIEVREFEDGSREMIYPPEGEIEFVVVQSTAGDLIPEGENLLTGKPVQTVYLWVGGDREWVMQYCIPGQQSAATKSSQMVISLSPIARLDPPLLRLAFLPKAAANGRRTLFHAVLGTDGTLRDLRAVNATGDSADELLQVLANWRFRPARRDGVPQEIEILLLVPGPVGTKHG